MYGQDLGVTNLGDVSEDAYRAIEDTDMVPIEVVPQVPATKRIELELTLYVSVFIFYHTL